eukprot:TRINITY_DN504_c0_g3_i1.p1 TRINITY_DN504_c0_g3~~TRINITY_DN504_c0_g3_i1.p1  ORF type:complete len:168 (+),score=19.54 TRINITY_DN504_c0_g3_i1:75-578(+)
MCIRDRSTQSTWGKQILQNIFDMKIVFCFAFVLCVLAQQARAQFRWEGFYSVGDECSSLRCDRESYDLLQGGEIHKQSIACPKGGSSNNIASIKRVGSTYIMQLPTYNLLDKDSSISLFLESNNQVLQLVQDRKVRWILRQEGQYIMVDRSNWNKNSKCDFKLKKID